MSDSSLSVPDHLGEGTNPLATRPRPVGGIENGYLVLQSAGRWSDVFRLSSPMEVVLGRSSSNDIAIRSEKASRQHARIWSASSGWMIEDLGSRNGTFVNGDRVESRELSEGDKIEIAGFSLEFVHRIQSAEGPVASPSPAGATDDQLTMAMESASILARRDQSDFFRGDLARGLSHSGEASRASLLQLAFGLAGAESVPQAFELVLDQIERSIGSHCIGGYLSGGRKSDGGDDSGMTLVATRQSKQTIGSTSYRHPAPTAIASVIGADGQAILARNVAGDRTLATENSQGEIDAVSMILVPVRDRERHLLGMLHLLSADANTVYTETELEFVLAIAEILAESLRNLRVRGKLDRSLKRTQRQVRALKEQLANKVEIVGKSTAVQQIIQTVAMAAPTNATVLVRGESGVGKELVASALHHASDRASGPLICMNCAALSPSLLESELFGHEKGAFTGATDRKRGKFEAADGGTLMLDEIGEMDSEIQAKFLRVLEGHPFERVGGQAPIRVDVRVVAATNRDLQTMVAEGKFRQDLFYRLHVVEILVPPLRQRGADIVLLAEHFLAQFNSQMGRRIERITDAARKKLLDYQWPGNIRELRNVIERAVVLNTGDSIEAEHLLLTPAIHGGGSEATSQSSASVEMSLAELERQHIERVLRHTDGNKSRASAILGIERSTLDRKLKRFAQQ
ncbi:MAG: sigma 54-interacting transcriptional regulator [Planctomycetota bacterium]